MELVILGAGLLAATLLMVLVGRPRGGDTAPFLRSWPVGQAYALTAMTSAIMGVTLIIANWPH